jgi:hypothetical protein
MITEKLLQFIWKFKYFNTKDLKTVQGETVQLLQHGTHNLNQGPDFLNAKIKIGITTLAGNIELHIQSTDWYKHQHQKDKNYNNIILHVVWEHNIAEEIIHQYPVVELKHYVNKILLDKYASLMEQYQFIPCEKQIKNISALQLNNWKERLLLERLEQKTATILQTLENNKGNWEETFWQKIARNFGLKVNADAFEEMAKATPNLILAKNKLSLPKIEALLFGQAKLLEVTFENEYALMLQKEYRYLKTKYNLAPSILPALFLRMRPYSFPTIRLSQLANLTFQSSKLFSKVLECKTYPEIMQMLQVKANDYWHYHYKLDDETSKYQEKYLGEDMQHNIIINTIAPIVFAYGIYKKEENFKEKALLWLEQIPTENNTIIKGFRNIEIKCKTASDSQALIQLKNNYCTKVRCLECAVGASLLKN